MSAPPPTQRPRPSVHVGLVVDDDDVKCGPSIPTTWELWQFCINEMMQGL